MKVKAMLGLGVVLGLSLLLAGQPGCESTGKTVSQAKPLPAQAELCTACGQIKGSAVCCKPGQTACGGCGLVKGSPGCCKITKGSSKPVVLCNQCGQIKGSAACCKPNQPTCAKCGLAKGSPGCCKIKKSG